MTATISTNTLKVDCLKTYVRVGQTDYPIFVGFLSSAEIMEVAETPQFLDTTTHQKLANSVLTPPMDDWQRPLNENRVQAISHVFNHAEIMPNPVLLSENGNLGQLPIKIEQQRASNSVPTKIWEIEIPRNASPKPLWILDGQHRIHGLFASHQRDNDIPVVLLLNDHHVYTGSILAKIFAQVTTGAQELDPLHHEWLTYAFRLGVYNDAKQHSEQHQRAMEAVCELCARPQFTIGSRTIANVFVNNIRFNVHNMAGQSFAFNYDCKELKQMFFKHYYSATSAGPHLDPLALAAEICQAVQALQLEVAAPQDQTVFFGDTSHAQKVLKDAFIIACLKKILTTRPPIDWIALLRNLQFSTTPWNFAVWTRSLAGQHNTASRNVAINVLSEAFTSGSLPGGSINLADYLRGNAASVDLVCSVPTPGGRGSARQATKINIIRGASLSSAIKDQRHLVLRDQTTNIANIKVVDANSTPGRPKLYPQILTRAGMVLNVADHASPIVLDIRMEFYGGVETPAEVALTWTE